MPLPTLLGAQAEPLGACAAHAAKLVGPITSYLVRFFELLPASAPLLVQLGDGLEEEERKVSGWNKLVHTLLASLRERIRDGNVLHTEEQLVVFRGCARRDVDMPNSALLADLLEAKHVDPSHVAPLVKFVLGAHGFHTSVRDSALRAMMRLGQEDRDALHRNLLSAMDSNNAGSAGGAARGDSAGAARSVQLTLPLPVLFSLCVTQLAEDVLPLVSAQLKALRPKQWDALLTLVADANPTGGKPPHTYPRSLGAVFNERLLAKYLRLQAMRADDPRYFLLFLACTPPERVPSYLLSVLAVQRHPLNELFLNALTRMSRAEFGQVLEHLAVGDLGQPARLEWVLRAVQKAGDPCELLGALFDVLEHAAYRAVQPSILASLLMMPAIRELFKHDEFRQLFRARLPRLEWAARGRDERFEPLRAVYVAFYRESWAAGAPLDSAASLAVTLHLGDKGGEQAKKAPLTSREVHSLGVDLRSMRLLVELAPSHAIPAFGFALLESDPSFAKSLKTADLERVTQLTAKELRDDQHWAVCRKVIGHVEPAVALRLAISLVCHSRELADLHLVEAAYKAVDGFTRKQVWLPTELSVLWSRKLPDAADGTKRTFGDAILEVVAGAAAPDQTMQSILEAVAWRPPPPGAKDDELLIARSTSF